MSDYLAKAQYYRDQAAHLRRLAALDDNPPTHKALIELAESYERLYVKFLEFGAPTPKE